MTACMSGVVACLQSYSFDAVESVVLSLATMAVGAAVVYGAVAVVVHVLRAISRG